MTDQQKISDLELTVRTIDNLIPDMPTKALQKWSSIFQTTLLKINRELTATNIHTCVICFHEELGYRDDLPVSWYKKGNAEICFQHEYSKAEELLRGAGWVDEANEPIEIEPIDVENLKVTMKQLPPVKTEEEATLEELLSLV